MIHGAYDALIGRDFLPKKSTVASSFVYLRDDEEQINEIFAQFVPESGRVGREILLGRIAIDAEKFSTPIYVIGAEKDNVIDPNVVAGVASFYCTVPEWFPELGHMCILEDGWEDVACACIDWLTNQEVSVNKFIKK